MSGGFIPFLNVIAFKAKAAITAEVASHLHRFHGATRAEALMADIKFLTPEELSARYRGVISVGTLRNWRAMRIGLTFVKIGKAVLYPTSELDAWDQKNMVTCGASKRLDMDPSERA